AIGRNAGWLRTELGNGSPNNAEELARSQEQGPWYKQEGRRQRHTLSLGTREVEDAVTGTPVITAAHTPDTPVPVLDGRNGRHVDPQLSLRCLNSACSQCVKPHAGSVDMALSFLASAIRDGLPQGGGRRTQSEAEWDDARSSPGAYLFPLRIVNVPSVSPSPSSFLLNPEALVTKLDQRRKKDLRAINCRPFPLAVEQRGRARERMHCHLRNTVQRSAETEDAVTLMLLCYVGHGNELRVSSLPLSAALTGTHVQARALREQLGKPQTRPTEHVDKLHAFGASRSCRLSSQAFGGLLPVERAPWSNDHISQLPSLDGGVHEKFINFEVVCFDLAIKLAITLENQLVILAATASDAGAYYVQAVNERNGENKTSPLIHLSIAKGSRNSTRKSWLPEKGEMTRSKNSELKEDNRCISEMPPNVCSVKLHANAKAITAEIMQLLVTGDKACPSDPVIGTSGPENRIRGSRLGVCEDSEVQLNERPAAETGITSFTCDHKPVGTCAAGGFLKPYRVPEALGASALTYLPTGESYEYWDSVNCNYSRQGRAHWLGPISRGRISIDESTTVAMTQSMGHGLVQERDRGHAETKLVRPQCSMDAEAIAYLLDQVPGCASQLERRRFEQGCHNEKILMNLILAVLRREKGVFCDPRMAQGSRDTALRALGHLPGGLPRSRYKCSSAQMCGDILRQCPVVLFKNMQTAWLREMVEGAVTCAVAVHGVATRLCKHSLRLLLGGRCAVSLHPSLTATPGAALGVVGGTGQVYLNLTYLSLNLPAGAVAALELTVVVSKGGKSYSSASDILARPFPLEGGRALMANLDLVHLTEPQQRDNRNISKRDETKTDYSAVLPHCHSTILCSKLSLTQFYIMTTQIQWLTVVSVSLLQFLRRWEFRSTPNKRLLKHTRMEVTGARVPAERTRAVVLSSPMCQPLNTLRLMGTVRRTPPAADGRDQGVRGPCQGVLQFPIVLANSLRRASIAPDLSYQDASSLGGKRSDTPVETLLQAGEHFIPLPGRFNNAEKDDRLRSGKRSWGPGPAAADKTKGLVLGICGKEKEDDVPQFTSAGENFNKLVSGKLREILNVSGPPLKAGKTQSFYGLHEDFPRMVVVGLGKTTAGVDEQENWHEGKENIRAAVAAGCRQVQDPEIPSVEVDPCGDAHAHGAVLGLYEYDDLKQKKKVAMSVKPHGSGHQEAWQRGVLFASGQNLACHLMETPAKEMTPTRFSGITEKNLKSASSATDVALGSAATGVSTNSSWLWSKLFETRIETGDRVWRMPLFEHYTRQVVGCQLADVNNICRSTYGCSISERICDYPKWERLDTAGVMTDKDEAPYLCKGVAGRPTRTLIEFCFGRPSWQRDGKPRGRAGTEDLGLPFTVVLRPRVPWHVLCATRRLMCAVYTYKHTSKSTRQLRRVDRQTDRKCASIVCYNEHYPCYREMWNLGAYRVPRASALSATGDVGTPEAVAPVIVIPPSNRSVVAGSSETTLECIANARPVEELSVTWKRNGVRVTSGLHSFGRRLTISTPTSSDVGEYVCEAALAGSAFEPATAKAFLSIIGRILWLNRPGKALKSLCQFRVIWEIIAPSPAIVEGGIPRKPWSRFHGPVTGGTVQRAIDVPPCFKDIVNTRGRPSYSIHIQHNYSGNKQLWKTAPGNYHTEKPPYFTEEPESRILVEVEETVDIVCGAMGECGEPQGKQRRGGGTEMASPGQSRPLDSDRWTEEGERKQSSLSWFLKAPGKATKRRSPVCPTQRGHQETVRHRLVTCTDHTQLGGEQQRPSCSRAKDSPFVTNLGSAPVTLSAAYAPSDPNLNLLPGGETKLRPEDSGIFQCFASNEGGEVQTYTYLDVTSEYYALQSRASQSSAHGPSGGHHGYRRGDSRPELCGVRGSQAGHRVEERKPLGGFPTLKGNRILASGSVQIPRFMLLESGGLQITPVLIQDAGNYTCCAANSEGSLNASATLTVWNRTSIVNPPEDRVVIKGTTATLHCGTTHDPRTSLRYVWKKDNVVITPSGSSRIVVEKDGSLLISQTWSGDIGDYTCGVISEGGNDSRTARLEVM
ncbi:hypothetical protein E2I00_001920, partial [Balaenoptera physalus]